jgi:hypothetical protein
LATETSREVHIFFKCSGSAEIAAKSMERIENSIGVRRHAKLRQFFKEGRRSIGKKSKAASNSNAG